MTTILSEEKSVTYLGNALGEPTGHGGTTGQRLFETFAPVIPFENGPGVVLPYLVMLGQNAFAQGNLELAYNDEFWAISRDELFPQYDAQDKFKARALAIAQRIAEQGIAAYVYVDESMPARYVVCAGYRLAEGISTAEISEALRAIFDEAANG